MVVGTHNYLPNDYNDLTAYFDNNNNNDQLEYDLHYQRGFHKYAYI
jgi:hypothetical protein